MFYSSTKLIAPKLFNHKNLSSKKNLFFCILLLSNTETRGFRILFNKPARGQGTNNNGSTAKNTTHMLFTYKYNIFKQLSSTPLTKPIFVSEYVNLF
jgi:hypothetical protein